MPLQRNEFFASGGNLLSIASSPSGLTDPRTGTPYQMGGLQVGAYFDLTEQEAQNYSGNILHEGRYRFVQIDSTATAANIRTGTIGFMKTVALGVNFITSADKALTLNTRQVVFLASPSATQVAAGCYMFVLEQGMALVTAKAALGNGSPAIGDFINATNTGVVDDPASQVPTGPTIGIAIQLPAAGGQFLMFFDAVQVQG